MRAFANASVLVTAATAACAVQSANTPRPIADLITRQEIVETGARTAMDAVRLLRPTWLRLRGSGVSGPRTPPIVYLDNVRWGPTSELDRIHVADISAIRFFSPADATMRWGTGHDVGVIEVLMHQ